MKKTDIVLSLELLADRGACEQGLYDFEKWYPSDSAPLSEVLRKIQELAYTNIEYVDYAIWLTQKFPPTQEPLVLNELTEKVIIHNGDVTINCDIDGDYVIIVNGNLNIKGDANLSNSAQIRAKNVKGQNITLYDFAEICMDKTVDAINISANGHARIWAVTIDAKNIKADDKARIWALEKINTKNIM